MLASEVFKAYDVRGTYPDQIDEQGGYVLGRAYARHFEPATVCVGHDMRLSARPIAEAVIRGLCDEGVDVVDLGMVGTEILYFAVANHEYDGGLQITASHNPAAYIGAKIVRRRSIPVGIDSGLADIRDIARTLDADDPVAERSGSVTELAIQPEFHAKMNELVPLSDIKPLTVVLDAGNGLGIEMIKPLLDDLPITLHTYNAAPDGTFPNHEPNPLLESNRQFIIEKVQEHNADIGIAWDGDADRCFFIDADGSFVPGDFITALIARHLLANQPGEKIIYDIRASWAVPETITAAGGVPVPSRVGHAFIKHRMRDEDALFAGEVSGHYYFRDFNYVDTGIMPALLLLKMVSASDGGLRELIQPFTDNYHITGEINSTVEDVPLKLQQVKERYRDGNITHIDGVSIEFDDWKCNIRSSNTEPLLRLNLETRSADELDRRRDEVLDLIRSDTRSRL